MGAGECCARRRDHPWYCASRAPCRRNALRGSVRSGISFSSIARKWPRRSDWRRRSGRLYRSWTGFGSSAGWRRGAGDRPRARACPSQRSACSCSLATAWRVRASRCRGWCCLSIWLRTSISASSARSRRERSAYAIFSATLAPSNTGPRQKARPVLLCGQNLSPRSNGWESSRQTPA